MAARLLAAVLACAGAVPPGAAGSAAQQMTFEEVLTAVRRNPQALRLAADIDAAEARLVRADTYPYNPRIDVGVADRDRAEGSTTDRSAQVSWQLELAGQRNERRAVAQAGLTAARAASTQALRQLVAGAAGAFAEAVARRELFAVERAEAELARSFATMVVRRLDAGAATAVDEVLAQAGLARAERTLALVAGGYRASQARLAEMAGATEVTLVEPGGDLPPVPEPPPVEQTIAQALSQRGDMRADRARLEAAEARLRLARSDRTPDLTVAARAAHEEGDSITGFSFSMPLPFIDRNQGAMAEAEVALAAARAELAARELLVRRQVAAALARFAAAVEARRLALQAGMTPLQEGLELLERSFEAGKIGAGELLLYRRELVEGRRQVVAAELEAWEAALELAIAAGVSLDGMEWMDAVASEEVGR